MSIILKEIDLPKKNQTLIVEIHPNRHCSIMRMEQGECYDLQINSEVEVIQISTPHGRLIDADKIFTYGHWEEQAVSEAPTILEAEE